MADSVADRRFVWEEGKSAQEIMESKRAQKAAAAPEIAATAKSPSPLTFWKVTWAVFMGNLFFAILATIVYEMSQH